MWLWAGTSLDIVSNYVPIVLVLSRTTVFFTVTKYIQYICHIDDLECRLRIQNPYLLNHSYLTEKKSKKSWIEQLLVIEKLRFTKQEGYNLEALLARSLEPLRTVGNTIEAIRKMVWKLTASWAYVLQPGRVSCRLGPRLPVSALTTCWSGSSDTCIALVSGPTTSCRGRWRKHKEKEEKERKRKKEKREREKHTN